MSGNGETMVITAASTETVIVRARITKQVLSLLTHFTVEETETQGN